MEKEKIIKFMNSLMEAKENTLIKILYRGYSLNMAFNAYKLDIRYNTIEDFSKKLFYFGDKSRHFWNKKIGSDDLTFGINEISDSMFKYIFDLFFKLISNPKKEHTKKYLNKNKEAKQFFSDKENLSLFLEKVNSLSNDDKLSSRNYYLTILHQLGETVYNRNSLLVSSSCIEYQTKRFSKCDGITIYFWDIIFKSQIELNKHLPYFQGKPYKNQKEITVFSAILPHYIYAFKYKKMMYYNPAIANIKNLDTVFFTGFEINQDDFNQRAIDETNYKSYVQTDGVSYKEIELTYNISK